MKTKYPSFLSVLFIVGILALFYLTLMPTADMSKSQPLEEFSTQRALDKVVEITRKPHYVGTKNHEAVAQYLQKELQSLGLETTVQEGYTLSDWGNLVKSKNILARIKGTDHSKALLLLSHYDSAPHSNSYGASDDATGVATILEGVRAFLQTKKQHKNDIIILFSDAEELGLNGAALFVTKHKWAKEVGLAINFEARGSSGPSYMLMEVNKGNAGMVKAFADANVLQPVSNSLMYSIYKMLPNDTDLTVFRQQGKIQGYNFAFIDGHYNYHTQQDNVDHLSRNSLAQQGAYLMPLLDYFSNADLSNIQSNTEDVYFTVPYSFISYPFDWVLPMEIIAAGILLILIFLGKAKRIINLTEVSKGFIPVLTAITVAGLITFLGWKVLLAVYPQYNDLLNGFTYNGHDYIMAFVFLSIAICFACYQFFSDKRLTMNHYIAPLILWVIINGFLANSLQGAGFLIISVYFGLFAFAFFIVTQKTHWLLNLICSIPTLLIVAPFIEMFPIGLGLKILFGSAILTVLVFGLMLPVFGAFAKKGLWALLFFLVAIGFFVKADYASGYEPGKAKSNSLVYFYDADTNQSHWATYDTNLDSWTKTYLGENPKDATALNNIPFFSKYNSRFTFAATAPKKAILKPTIEFLKDTIIDNLRHLTIKISPNRKVNHYSIYANEKMNFHHFKANGIQATGQKGDIYERNGKRILSYYVVGNEPLEMQFSINKTTEVDMDLMESSFDLMSNPLFNMKKRENWMMPTPFVVNDAVILKQKIKQNQTVTDKSKAKVYTFRISKENLKVVNDSIKTD